MHKNIGHLRLCVIQIQERTILSSLWALFCTFLKHNQFYYQFVAELKPYLYCVCMNRSSSTKGRFWDVGIRGSLQRMYTFFLPNITLLYQSIRERSLSKSLSCLLCCSILYIFYCNFFHLCGGIVSVVVPT